MYKPVKCSECSVDTTSGKVFYVEDNDCLCEECLEFIQKELADDEKFLINWYDKDRL